MVTPNNLMSELLLELKYQLIEIAAGDRESEINDIGIERIKQKLGINIDKRTLKKLFKEPDYVPRGSILNSITHALGFEDWPDFVIQMKQSRHEANTINQSFFNSPQNRGEKRKIKIMNGHYTEISGHSNNISIGPQPDQLSKGIERSLHAFAHPQSTSGNNTDHLPVIIQEYHYYIVIHNPEKIEVPKSS